MLDYLHAEMTTAKGDEAHKLQETSMKKSLDESSKMIPRFPHGEWRHLLHPIRTKTRLYLCCQKKAVEGSDEEVMLNVPKMAEGLHVIPLGDEVERKQPHTYYSLIKFPEGNTPCILRI